MTQIYDNEQARIDTFVMAVHRADTEDSLTWDKIHDRADELLNISDRIAQDRREAAKTTEASGK